VASGGGWGDKEREREREVFYELCFVMLILYSVCDRSMNMDRWCSEPDKRKTGVPTTGDMIRIVNCCSQLLMTQLIRILVQAFLFSVDNKSPFGVISCYCSFHLAIIFKRGSDKILLIVIGVGLLTDMLLLSLVTGFLPGTPLDPPGPPPPPLTLQSHTATLSVLCVPFPVQLSAVVRLSNVFPIQLTDISLSFPLQFQWLQL
jgi:hypothetical protein